MAGGLFGHLNRWKIPLVATVTSGYFAYDVYTQDRLKESQIVVKLRDKPVPGVLGDVPCISPHLQEIIEEVKSQLNLPQIIRESINYYATPYPKPKVNGFHSSFTHIDVFLPDYLNISSSDQLNAKVIHNLVGLMGENLSQMDANDWLTPDGKNFINSFIMSRRAKKFLIAQTSYSNLNDEYHIKYGVFALIVLASFLVFLLIGERVKGNLSFKLLFISMALIPMGLLKKLLSSHSTLACESKGIAQAISKNMLTAKELANLNDNSDVSLIDVEMLLGGIEYYSKVLQRQKAARRLFRDGFSFSGFLSEDGEEISPFQLELPKTQIIKQLESIRSKLRKDKPTE